MYSGKRNIKDPEKYEELRKIELVDKSGATFIAFTELEDIINRTQLARQYFNRSHAWLSQKIHGATVLNRKRSFTEDEYRKLADAFRDIARRLEAHAAEIDAAPMEEAPERVKSPRP